MFRMFGGVLFALGGGLAILSSAVICVGADTSNLKVTDLHCEYRTDPVGIDAALPRLSWRISGPSRGIRQTAYQIRVAEDPGAFRKGAPLVWDSGKVDSDSSVHVSYQGPPTGSGQRRYWQVRIWDSQGQTSAWSSVAFWEMGLLRPSDWKGLWISPDSDQDVSKPQPSPMLRKKFHLRQQHQSARVYVTSLGLYELHLNNHRVSDHLFTPGWTSYDNRLQYQVYDVTGQLSQGENVIAAVLGDGWYRGRLAGGGRRNVFGQQLALLMQLHVRYPDGTEELILSDQSWKASSGPIRKADIYDGEVYDARLEDPAWTAADYDDSGWSAVRTLSPPKAVLVASEAPPVRRLSEIRPKRILTTPKGETVLDMGQNMVGWMRLRIQGARGLEVVLRHAEVLDQDGNFYTKNLRTAEQTDRYILKGEGVEVFEPHFTFHGFRYVLVEGLSGPPSEDTLTGIVIHSDLKPTGHFECSNPAINQLQSNILWGQKGNFLDVPTDCPQRDERLGWTGDAQVFAQTAAFNMDVAAFFSKWLKDLAADQKTTGAFQPVAPVLWDRDSQTGPGQAGWGDAGVIVPWHLYLVYGDKRILEQQYDSMAAWVRYVNARAGSSHLWNTGFQFGDWLAFSTDRSDYPGATTDKDLIATAFFAYSTGILEQAATVLDKREDARKYRKLRQAVIEAFRHEFVTPSGRLSSNTQTAYALALSFDLLPPELVAQGAKRLADDVRAFKNHLTTGFLGTPFLCHALSDHGYLGVAYDLLLQDTYPSWLYPIKQGATTIWERWDGIKPDGTFQNPRMNSFNHYAYGAIGHWLYRVVAGIDLDPQAPGYKHVLISPQPGGGLNWARGRFESVYGEIVSAWVSKPKGFRLEVVIPANTTATVRLPGAVLSRVKEGAQTVKSAPGILAARQEKEAVMVEVGSGQYRFEYEF